MPHSSDNDLSGSERELIRKTRPDTRQLLSDYRERVYRALKDHDFELYRKCIQSAEAVSINHNANHRLAADIEAAVVMQVAEAIGVKASPNR